MDQKNVVYVLFQKINFANLWSLQEIPLRKTREAFFGEEKTGKHPILENC